jgi:hypothetical protein
LEELKVYKKKEGNCIVPRGMLLWLKKCSHGLFHPNSSLTHH